VLLALAIRALGTSRVVAIIGVSPSLADDELAAARELTGLLSVERIELPTYEGDRAEYIQNAPDRCYFCKDELFTRIADDVRARKWLGAVAYGETSDDAHRPDRPGSRAAEEHNVLRPLASAGIDKAAVRELAFEMGLPNWNKPAAPCLASRIPHFSTVVPAKLRQVQDVERVLRAAGFADCRVRHHGNIARIEVPADQLPRLVVSPLREMIAAAADAAGFEFATLDIRGIQSGRLTLLATQSEK
jgi:uncharacterized protein